MYLGRMIALAPNLADPLWHPQAGETAGESAAFSEYLLARSQQAVCQRLGWPAQSVQETAVRWAWRERCVAYDRAVAQAGWDDRRARAQAVLARRSERMSKVLEDCAEYLEREIAAHLAISKAAPLGVPTATTLDLMRIATIERSIAETLIDATRGFAEDHGQATPIEFDRLSREDLDAWERTVRKARGLVGG